MKIVYFAGKGRSGTTLLDNVLGQVDDFVSIGELTKLWTWGLKEGWKCGCGRAVPECPFWAEVMGAAFGPGRPPRADEVASLQERVLNWRRLPRLLRAASRGTAGWADLEEYVEITTLVYRGVAEVSGARVIVDSSKWPAGPAALGLIPGFDVYLLHVVRDPRAVTNSWKRTKAWTDRDLGETMPTYGVPYSMASYWVRNVVAEYLASRPDARSMRLRYEDFSAAPGHQLESIFRFLGEKLPADLLSDDAVVELVATHSAGGNPNRLDAGRVKIRPDDRWRSELSLFDKSLATALGLPFLLRYRYPVVPARRTDHSITGPT